MKTYEIIPDLLIRGQFHRRPNKLAELRELGVGTVICMLRRGDPDMLEQEIGYVQVPLPDASYVDEAALRLAVRIAETALDAGQRVLVHCISAHDRAPLVAAVVAARRLGLTGGEAYWLLKEKRGSVALRNQAFMRYLISERWRSL